MFNKKKRITAGSFIYIFFSGGKKQRVLIQHSSEFLHNSSIQGEIPLEYKRKSILNMNNFTKSAIILTVSDKVQVKAGGDFHGIIMRHSAPATCQVIIQLSEKEKEKMCLMYFSLFYSSHTDEAKDLKTTVACASAAE